MRRTKLGRTRGPRIRTAVNRGEFQVRSERGARAQRAEPSRPGRARIVARDIGTRLAEKSGGGRSMRSGR